jgi:isoamylase
VDKLSAFFDIIQQDPVISQVKLIAEPWDVGDGGYQVGNFPPLWTEWNGKYRDTVRDFWRGVPATLGEFASRLTGSSDLYEHSSRKPIASINFITAHDGFTLRDLVSYNEKHNDANLEGNRDGESHNRSWNCGAEGPTDEAAINHLRARQQRNFLTTLLLSQGVPMIAHGDELGRTQDGNNNVYCQDNELSWVDWVLTDEQKQLLAFTKTIVALRANHPVFRRRRFFAGSADHGGESNLGDIYWLKASGDLMSESDWAAGEARLMGMWLNGSAIPEPDGRGRRILDDDFLIIFNAGADDAAFTLPTGAWGGTWSIEVDTGADVVDGECHGAGSALPVGGRSIIVLRSRREEPVVPAGASPTAAT